MQPANFDGSNTIFGAPKGTEHVVAPLYAYRGPRAGDGLPVVVSCWKPSREELEEIMLTGRVWLVVLGESMPPVWLQSQNPQSWAKPMTPA